MSLETLQNIWETHNQNSKEELKNLRSNVREKDRCLKSKLRLLKDRSKGNNICVEGIANSKNQGWQM